MAALQKWGEHRGTMEDMPARARVARPPRVTSFDVAAEAGVSQSTVSRALAGDPVVSAATRQRVIEAARKLDYHVDENAARLRTGRTGTIAVVVVCRPGEDRKDFNPFHLTLLGSVCSAASARGYETLVSFQDEPDTFNGLYQEKRKADGLIVLGTTENPAAWAYFRDRAAGGDHMVFWGSPFDDLDWIRSDNAEGARLATGHLIEQGRKAIACIASLGTAQRQFDERYEGHAERMRAAGLEPWLIDIEPDLPREEQGRRAAARILASGCPCDGIFAVCDEIALGALGELARAGIDVPGAIAVIGFDGIRGGSHANPPLTSIAPDFAEAGAMLVDKLMLVMADEPTGHRRVPVHLLLRASA